jgi:hypothetical protein
MYNYSTQLKNEFSQASKNMPFTEKKSEIFPSTKVENEVSNNKKDRSSQEKASMYAFKRDPKVWY